MAAPGPISYGLIQSSRAPSPHAVVLRNFMRVPLHVQAECRLRSYRDHLPPDLGSAQRDVQFHYYSGSEGVVGLFGCIPPHEDAQTGQTRRLTTGLTLVNDGRTRLAIPTSRGTQEYPLPVGSLYVMDSAHTHCTVADNELSLYAFLVLDWQWQTTLSAPELRAGMRDTLRTTFGYDTDKVSRVWSPDA